METTRYDAAGARDPNVSSARRVPTLVLRLAIAACFICHGIMALKSSFVLYSEWVSWVQLILPSPDYSLAKLFLRCVGSIDLLVGLSFLGPRPPRLAFVWAVGWGGVTALSRLYFLGSLTGDPWMNLLLPVAEAVARTANWLVPLALLCRRWSMLRTAVAMTVFGLVLHYLADYLGPTYPYEVAKVGMPLWLFHVAGLSAAVALATLPVRGGMLFALAAAGIVEGFQVFALDWPRGYSYALLHIGEHAPVYLCLVLEAWRRRGGASWRPMLFLLSVIGCAGCSDANFSGGSPSHVSSTAKTCPASAAKLALSSPANACSITPNGKEPARGMRAVVLTDPAPCDFFLPNVTVSGMTDPYLPDNVVTATLPIGTYWKDEWNPDWQPGKIGRVLGVAHSFPVGPKPANAPIIDNGFLLVQPDGKSYLLVDAGWAVLNSGEVSESTETVANEVSQSLGFGPTTLLQPTPGTAAANYTDGTNFAAGSVIALYDDTPDMGGAIDVNALVTAATTDGTGTNAAGPAPGGAPTPSTAPGGAPGAPPATGGPAADACP